MRLPVVHDSLSILCIEDLDKDIVFIARAAPTSWFQASEPFGLKNAPTRFGMVSFSIQPSASVVSGTVELEAHPNAAVKDAVFTVRIPSGQSKFTVQGAELVSYSETKHTVTLRPTQLQFSFNATFTSVIDTAIALI